MKLYLVRHGETKENTLGIMQGHMDNPLSEQGLKQAQLIAKRLSNEPINTIYSSDLKRALTTAQEIALHHDKEVILSKELRERDLGSFSGKTIKEVDWSKLPDDFESDESMTSRVNHFLKKLRKHEDESVLVVSHGRYIKMLIGLLTNRDLGFVKKQKYDNTGLSVLNINNNKVIIELENNTKHLG